jgi:uracil-DNA glycosylase
MVAKPQPSYRPAPAPKGAALAELAQLARGCTACPLYAGATQTVFGAGPEHAPIVMVGEQPGDQEDRQGQPFVGPAGKLLHALLLEAGVDGARVYLTNAVKHFKWEPRGTMRLHKKPGSREIAACRPWLEAELARIHPQAVVALGATAARALLGPGFKISLQRGLVAAPWAPVFLATVHPSSLLRAPTPEARREARELFVGDLRALVAAMAKA